MAAVAVSIGIADCAIHPTVSTLARRARDHPLAVLDAGCGTGENLALKRYCLRILQRIDLSQASNIREQTDADLYLGDIASSCTFRHADFGSCGAVDVPGKGGVPGLEASGIFSPRAS